MTTGNVIERIQRHAQQIAAGEDAVKPGQAVRFTAACFPGDAIRQGDLYLVLVAPGEVPPDYRPVERPTSADCQLVPGNTVGAKHCLDSIAGVELFRPSDWPNAERLDGPYVFCREKRTVLHPTHGAVTIPAGMAVQCHYQREFDSEQQRERRAAD